jgi:hypothetical protein
MNVLPAGLALLWNSPLSSWARGRRSISSCTSQAGFGSNSPLTRASSGHVSVDKTPSLTYRAAVRFGAISRSYYRHRSSMRFRASKSRDDWMANGGRRIRGEPKDEVNADLLVIAAGTQSRGESVRKAQECALSRQPDVMSFSVPRTYIRRIGGQVS